MEVACINKVMYLPCGTTFLREFVFAHWRLFVFCYYDKLFFFVFFSANNEFLRISNRPGQITDNIFIFIDYVQ